MNWFQFQHSFFFFSFFYIFSSRVLWIFNVCRCLFFFFVFSVRFPFHLVVDFIMSHSFSMYLFFVFISFCVFFFRRCWFQRQRFVNGILHNYVTLHHIMCMFRLQKTKTGLCFHLILFRPTDYNNDQQQ